MGCAVNTAVVFATAEGIVKDYEVNLLVMMAVKAI